MKRLIFNQQAIWNNAIFLLRCWVGVIFIRYGFSLWHQNNMRLKFFLKNSKIKKNRFFLLTFFKNSISRAHYYHFLHSIRPKYSSQFLVSHTKRIFEKSQNEKNFFSDTEDVNFFRKKIP